MGWTFLDIDTLPEPGDIVWCKFPYSRGKPGPIARPTLVRSTATYENPETGTLYGAVDVSYGTGEYTEDQCQIDLVIRDWEAVKRCGLHKPTRFALDTGNRKNLIWCEEYFVPPEYVEETGLLIGRLGEMEVDQMRLSLIRRGLFAA